MSRREPGRYHPPPVRDRHYSGPCDAMTVASLKAKCDQQERDLNERDRQVLSLQAEVRRLTALLSRDQRKSHPKPTRREKVAMNGHDASVSHA